MQVQKVPSRALKSKNRYELEQQRCRTPGRAAPRELRSPERKLRYNRRLFSVVARRYDLVTRLLSFGRDAAWKRKLLRVLPPASAWTNGSAPVVLDIACGTGDITLLLAEKFPAAEITGIDLTEEMLRRARRRIVAPGNQRRENRRGTIHFVQGDMNALDKPSGSTDIVTGGYALRNAPDLDHTLREIHRVLRPGGYAAFLEFSRSASPGWSAIQLRLLRFWGQVWGILLHGDPEVYAYIARSLASFPDEREFAALLRRLRFTGMAEASLLLGFARITVVRKPER